MPNAELNRRIENLIRLGTIAEVDHAAALCRVESGGLLTDWLPWFERRAGATREWNPPTVGEQVMVLSPSGVLDGGLVLLGLFSTAHAAPSHSPDEHVIDYPDGARIAYNHASGALTVTGIKTALVQASESVTADTPYTHITGDTKIDGTLEVDGLITYHSGMHGEAGAGGGGAIVITGDLIHQDGVLQSNGVVLHTHTHTGVQPGGGDTGLPQ